MLSDPFRAKEGYAIIASFNVLVAINEARGGSDLV